MMGQLVARALRTNGVGLFVLVTSVGVNGGRLIRALGASQAGRAWVPNHHADLLTLVIL